LTSARYFESLWMQPHPPEIARVLECKADFIIVGKESTRLSRNLGNERDNRIMTRVSGKQITVSNLEKLLSSGCIKIDKEVLEPDIFIGLDPGDNDLIAKQKKNWISYQDVKELKNLMHLSTNINIYDWLREELKNREHIQSVTIEDPYFFKNFTDDASKDKLMNVLDILVSEKGLKHLFIKYRNKDRLPAATIHTWKEEIKDLLEGFEAHYSEKRFHDRMLIIDGLIYLVGHSLNMPRDSRTYVVGMDKLTYLANSAD